MKGEITKALEEALELRKKLVADGTPEAEADYITGQGLKGVLGNRREVPWRFYCEHCRDTGFITVTPSDEELARVMRLYGTVAVAPYVVTCEPCNWQQLERKKRRKQTGDECGGDDLVAAGQTKKPKRTFTKFGR